MKIKKYLAEVVLSIIPHYSIVWQHGREGVQSMRPEHSALAPASLWREHGGGRPETSMLPDFNGAASNRAAAGPKGAAAVQAAVSAAWTGLSVYATTAPCVPRGEQHGAAFLPQ